MLLVILQSAIVNDAFESLFFGTGAIFGLIIFITLCVGLCFKWKYVGALLLPLIMLFEAEYVSRLNAGGNFVWHIFVLVILALFIALKTLDDIRSRR